MRSPARGCNRAVVAILAAAAIVGGRRKVAAPFWVLAFAGLWRLTVQAGLSTSLTAVAFAARSR